MCVIFQHTFNKKRTQQIRIREIAPQIQTVGKTLISRSIPLTDVDTKDQQITDIQRVFR